MYVLSQEIQTRNLEIQKFSTYNKFVVSVWKFFIFYSVIVSGTSKVYGNSFCTFFAYSLYQIQYVFLICKSLSQFACLSYKKWVIGFGREFPQIYTPLSVFKRCVLYCNQKICSKKKLDNLGHFKFHKIPSTGGLLLR